MRLTHCRCCDDEPCQLGGVAEGTSAGHRPTSNRSIRGASPYGVARTRCLVARASPVAAKAAVLSKMHQHSLLASASWTSVSAMRTSTSQFSKPVTLGMPQLQRQLLRHILRVPCSAPSASTDVGREDTRPMASVRYYVQMPRSGFLVIRHDEGGKKA